MEAFRYFKDINYAEQMAAGRFQISTLSACREYEESKRGDQDEGTGIYNTGYLTGDNPNFTKLARKAGISLSLAHPNASIILNNNVITTRIPDAYIICMSHQEITDPETLDTFGRHYVKISDVELFSHRVGIVLSRQINANFNHEKGRVSYGGHHHAGEEPSPGRIGFTKEARYSPQHEYRAMWIGDSSHHHQKRLLFVPRIVNLCEVGITR